MRYRNCRFEVCFTEDELSTFNEKAKKAHLSRGAFIRRLLNGAEIKEAPPAEYYDLIREIRRVGSNINQILSLANARGFLNTPQLRKALEQNHAVEKMLWDTFSIKGR